jgi:hypothetical protein
MFVSISATCVNASTDCERWFVAYRSELAHSRNLQRIAAAKRRAKLYAQRKLAGYVPSPKPKLVPAGHPRTRKETLHHFNLACGVLPEDAADEPVIAEDTPPPFTPHPLNDGLDLLPSGLDEMIAENDVPPPPFTDGVAPGYTSGGGPPIFQPPFTGQISSPGGGSPGTGTTAAPPGPPTPPVTPAVPEPASYVLMLTGIVGAAGAVRCRFKV